MIDKEKISKVWSDYKEFDKKVMGTTHSYGIDCIDDYLMLRKNGLIEEYLEILKKSNISIKIFYKLMNWLKTNEVNFKVFKPKLYTK